MEHKYTNRDISWLAFNERVLQEAMNKNVPLLERFKFLSIYSSNLDEFYRVRMPAIAALTTIEAAQVPLSTMALVKEKINRQQQLFGDTLRTDLLPGLESHGIYLVYNVVLPATLKKQIADYFFTRLAAYLQPVYLSQTTDFFPENNKIYLLAAIHKNGAEDLGIVAIPSVEAGRFVNMPVDEKEYILFIDDIIREHRHSVWQDCTISGVYSIKVTRDAELDLADEYKGDIVEQIATQIARRDFGLATRLLYDTELPATALNTLVKALKLDFANNVAGGRYHNLKDLAELPVKQSTLSFARWPAVLWQPHTPNIWDALQLKDIMVHPPYHSYDTVLRFFNEAALDEQVTDMYITLYRVAGDSRIAQALISAAKNGKSVTVFVELKARFDEANNLRWAAKMKAAGVQIIYSIPGLKVHAKVALVKRKEQGRLNYYGIFATGNFNETTAKFYTDHILLTANGSLLRELELLFLFLTKRKKPTVEDNFTLEHLLIAQFNLKNRFEQLVDDEIAAANKGLPALIRIKLNNLEEEQLINKLYEASTAGVTIELIVRGICTLRPGVKGLSDNITIRRIVDRYLEHGRIFHVLHGGANTLLLGSSDWMSRNIYRRIEVCFPIVDETIKEELLHLLDLQLADNVQAVAIDGEGSNKQINTQSEPVASQLEIYNYIKRKL